MAGTSQRCALTIERRGSRQLLSGGAALLEGCCIACAPESPFGGVDDTGDRFDLKEPLLHGTQECLADRGNVLHDAAGEGKLRRPRGVALDFAQTPDEQAHELGELFAFTLQHLSGYSVAVF